MSGEEKVVAETKVIADKVAEDKVQPEVKEIGKDLVKNKPNPYLTYKIDRALDNASHDRQIKDLEIRIKKLEEISSYKGYFDVAWWWVVFPIVILFYGQKK